MASVESVLRERARRRARLAPPSEPLPPASPPPTETDTAIRTQGGILVEVDQGRRYRVGEDGLLHFRVRNLTGSRGRLRMRIAVGRTHIHCGERRIELWPGGLHEVCFPVSSETPGEKLVESLEVHFELAGRSRTLVLPDHTLTFEVSSRARDLGGSIDLRGATIDLREHIGDFFVRNLIQSQDQENPPAKGEDWRALALVPRSEGRVVDRGARKRGVRDLVLLGPPSLRGFERRHFLFARQDLPFGAIRRFRDLDVPLVLRYLPGPAAVLDARGHPKNDYVSRLHGRFTLLESGLALRDEESTNGLAVNGRKLPANAWVPLPHRFEVLLTADEPVLRLSGKVCHARRRSRVLDLDATHGGRPHAGLEVGAEHALPIDALRLDRIDNHPEHTYVQVFRIATIGSSPGSAIHLDHPSVAPHHAELVFHKSEWLVHATDPDARTEIDGRRVREGEYVPIAPNRILTVGDTDLCLKATKLPHLTRP